MSTVESRNKSNLELMVYVIAIGLIASLAFHLAQAFVFNHNYYPHNTFLFIPADRFHDFTNIYKATIGLAPFASAVSVYPPFAYLVMLPFTILKRDMALAIMLAGFTVFVWKYIYKTVSVIAAEGKYSKTIVLAFMTYPFLFVFDRANIEALVFILLALFIHYYKRNEDFKSILCLACAISIKMYPGAFLLLYLANRKYKNILYTLLGVAVLTLISMVILKGGVLESYTGFLKNLAGFRLSYFVTDAGLQHNLSLFGALRLLYGHFAAGRVFPEFIYSVTMASSFALISLYVVFVERKLWRAVAVIVLFILIAPQVSFDYKFIHLLIPITLFLATASDINGDIFVASAFALLCVPKDYYLIRGDISIAVFLNPLIIIALLAILMWQGYTTKQSFAEHQALT